jgi:hypothetical protein
MPTLKFANNALSQLALPISPIATSIRVKAGTGNIYPVIGLNEEFYITFTDKATGLTNEIALCTSRLGDVLTVQRGVDGTTAKPWQAGDYVNMFPTAGTLDRFLQSVNGNVVTEVTASLPLSSSGGQNPNISLTGNIPASQIEGLGTMATQNSDNISVTGGNAEVVNFRAFQYFNLAGGTF